MSTPMERLRKAVNSSASVREALAEVANDPTSDSTERNEWVAKRDHAQAELAAALDAVEALAVAGQLLTNIKGDHGVGFTHDGSRYFLQWNGSCYRLTTNKSEWLADTWQECLRAAGLLGGEKAKEKSDGRD